MWYALIDGSSSDSALTWLAYGSLQDIANTVLELCKNCDPDGTLTFDAEAIEDFEDDEWYGSTDSYRELMEADEITPDLLQDFSFVFGDNDIQVHCLADGYAAFKKAFENYDGNNDQLYELVLPDELSAEEEGDFAAELADILLDEQYYNPDYYSDEWTYVSAREDE